MTTDQEDTGLSGAVSAERIETCAAREHPAQLVRRVDQQRTAFHPVGSDAEPVGHAIRCACDLAEDGAGGAKPIGAADIHGPVDKRASVIALTEAGRACRPDHVPGSLRAGDAPLAPPTPIGQILLMEAVAQGDDGRRDTDEKVVRPGPRRGRRSGSSPVSCNM